MKCGSGGGFDTCDHGRWVHRACGKGTSCRDIKGHIFCDYKTGGGGGSSCKDGSMKCGSGGGFDTCDHGRWVHRACGKGTSCRDVKGHIFCDYKTGGGGGNTCKDGAMKCGSGGGFDTCDHGRWVHRACGKGTSCRDVKGHIFCDYK
ncbi:hypothetical protein BGZ75_010311 [Mortierella antarctica]|nr:hypothetical protein BGZ75_010311 [Mortierella antarctica]